MRRVPQFILATTAVFVDARHARATDGYFSHGYGTHYKGLAGISGSSTSGGPSGSGIDEPTALRDGRRGNGTGEKRILRTDATDTTARQPHTPVAGLAYGPSLGRAGLAPERSA